MSARPHATADTNLRRRQHPTPGRGTEQSVLLVAACAGARCSALRRLGSANPPHTDGADSTEGRGSADLDANHDTRDPGRPARPESEVVLRAAIRLRRDAVLVSVPCLGPCHQGSLIAVGRGVTGPGDHTLSWLGRPTLLARTELPRRARALAAWITGTAPDLTTLPEPLHTDGAQP